MPTAVVAPLFRPDVRVAYSEVSLEVLFRSDRYVLAVGDLAAIDVRQLGKPVGDLKHMEDGLRRALERLFTGF